MVGLRHVAEGVLEAGMITVRAIGGGTNFESRKRAEGAYAVVARGVPDIDGAS
jgi:hypothetical protein